MSLAERQEAEQGQRAALIDVALGRRSSHEWSRSDPFARSYRHTWLLARQLRMEEYDEQA